MADKLSSRQESMLLNSQGSDLFPVEVKQCMDDPDIQDIINSVQNEDPFLNVQTDDLGYMNLNSQNAGIMEVVAADTVMIPQAPTPSPTCAMLSTENYPGPYDFEVQVNGEGSGKNWLFSYELNKLFINMNTIIHISFKRNSFPSGFYVRAIPVYTETEYFQHPVERCVHHRSLDRKDNHDIDEFLLNHVIRIEHPQTEYDYNETSKRWSVRVLLDSPQAGCDWVNIAFKFLCKNSCLSGMNKQPIEVIFTLEDYNAFVYGRQKFKVRICSCPKRDKMKEESDVTPKDPQAIRPGKHLMCPEEAPASRPTKQRKIDEICQIPQAPTPSPTCAMLSTENYPGPYDFEIQVNGEGSGKNWLFSYELNKLFINMNTIIHISFKRNSFPSGFYVRAIPVYTETEHFQHPVERCVPHRSLDRKDNHDIDEFLLNHVIRIEHPQAEYDYNETSKRWSVRLLLDSPQAGCDWVNIAFKFLCKNSCLSGMNRRPIEVIFTLEDYNAFVYGRQKLKVRICSSPKRDKMKEEAHMTPKDPQAIHPRKRSMYPKEAPASRPTKQRKTDEICQFSVFKSEYVKGLLYFNCRLKTKLQIEKRSPTEIENHILLDYEQELDDPDIQDVINSIQNQDPFLNVQTDDLGYMNLNLQNAGIMEVVAADTVMIPQAPTPSPTCAMLSTENYPGPYDFEVQVNGEGSGKNWLFSYELNQLFINMNTIIHISFKRNSFPSGFYVRAIPVYTETEHFQHPVERCVHHRSLDRKDNYDIDEFLLNHVIRIEHPQAEYDYNETSKRWSVRLVLDSPQAGCDWVNIAFNFLCKNSCLTGMNRRPIEVIFTLEDYNAFVYGRQKLKVRICNFPKRDKMKEEADMTLKDPQAIPPGKRLLCPKEAQASRPTKQRKTDEICQFSVLESEYVEGLLYFNCILKIKLQIEKRSPTEKENHILLDYEQELKKLAERAT